MKFQVRSNVIARSIATSLINQSEFDNLHHPEGREPSIPPYVERQGESANLKRARYNLLESCYHYYFLIIYFFFFKD